MPSDPTFGLPTFAVRASADRRATADKSAEALTAGAVVLRGFARGQVGSLFTDLARITAAAPFRHMITPGGFRMSVAMTNCGRVGWITDRGGYRYVPLDPLTGQPWPAMPPLVRELGVSAAAAGGYADFDPDACLVNRYDPGARMSLHQDRDERDLSAPVVSISLGLPATFLFGGERRNVRPRRVLLESGDAVVWGGPARLAFHGVAPLAEGSDPVTGGCRLNLTLRKAL
jgi:alkylated DNA repair protein (DNA oxidative demethylase)